MQQAVAMLRPIAEEKHVGLEIAADGRIPLVHADPDRIFQVLFNLVDNAIKFTPPDGSVMVKASLVDVDPDFVYVSVEDTGRGISPEAKNLIFERMFQDPDSIDNNRKGLGLGLYIAKELITLHGGRIWVASQPGHGSVFTLTLPLFSLAKLLQPVIVEQGRLREAVVLVKIELAPSAAHLPSSWRETCQRCLEILQHCVYLDKDVVLPPLGCSSQVETFFVAASTDLERAEIMMKRIRGQLERCPGLQGTARFTVSASAVALSARDQSVESQVEQVAGRIIEMVMASVRPDHISSTPTSCQHTN